MLSHKFILSLGTIVTLSASTSALAFQNVPVSHSIGTSMDIIYVGSETLEDGAINFVSKLAKKGIGILENEDVQKEQREKDFRKLLHNNFDMKTIARFSLGRYWKVSSKTEKKEYLNLFENMIINVYSKRFSEYNGQTVKVSTARLTGKADALVSSSIVPESGPRIHVDWRIRKKKNGQFKVIDIIVEGVSMSLTQRSDFASVIQRGGGKVEVLLAHLRPKS
ncbi:MAG: toluene tolerance protein [Alphaproteobacteria bacterium]|nr:MAG: toluene tolerance protein [Alphaproteobacteria bacterium]